MLPVRLMMNLNTMTGMVTIKPTIILSMNQLNGVF